MTETAEVDLSKLQSAGQVLARLAVTVGWHARNTVGGGVLLEIQHESGRQSISIPARSGINQNKASSWGAKLLRYGDPEAVAVYRMKFELSTQEEKRTGNVSLGNMPDLDTPMMTTGDAIPAEFELPGRPKPAIISEHPWLAKRGTSAVQGRHYESGTTVERKWSDGSVDYRCTVCEFTDPTPQRVAAHYRRTNKQTHPPVPQPTETYASEPYTPKPADLTARAERLAREFRNAVAEVGLPGSFESPEDFVTALALAVVKGRDARGETRELEPLTPEQTIERIRRLVDDGSYLRRIEQERELTDRATYLEERLSEMESDVAKAQVERDAAEEKARSAQERWDALASLIAENKGE